MQIDYFETVSSIINLMKQPESPCKNVAGHWTCYASLFKYLVENDIPFSMEAALDWINQKKMELSPESVSNYRNALFRMEHYILFGNIDSPFCRSDEFFLCRSGMSESFYLLCHEMEQYFEAAQNPCYYHTYSVAIKEFFKLATANGITEPETITIDILLKYWDEYCLKLNTLKRRQNAVCAMTALMKYLYQRGDVPKCYSIVLFNENAARIPDFKVPVQGNAFHPSFDLEPRGDEFMDLLDEWKYLESSKHLYRTDLTWYFIFLEYNHIDHSEESVNLWLSLLPEYPNQKRANCTVSARKAHSIKMFCNMLNESAFTNRIIKKPSLVNELPQWSQDIINSFLLSRKKDGMADKTINMCSASALRFFYYLDKKSIKSTDEITLEIITRYHEQDIHSTNESKNAYSIKLRQLLRFMADNQMIKANVALSVPACYAPHRNIVDVLSDEMVENIYDYREKASTPLELRDSAIIMLGLRMGIRGADIINLKLENFDWNKKTVSFVQSKTQKAVTLPIPTDVANSVYKYIAYGRPKAADTGNGYIFVRHAAPYVPFTVTTVCKSTLKRVLDRYGIKLQPGQGFHMTRKTFATKMLKSKNKLDTISNALGHTSQKTAEVYLERDEEGMRMCPLQFGGVL